jgi:hypothetical protein
LSKWSCSVASNSEFASSSAVEPPSFTLTTK